MELQTKLLTDLQFLEQAQWETFQVLGEKENLGLIQLLQDLIRHRLAEADYAFENL